MIGIANCSPSNYEDFIKIYNYLGCEAEVMPLVKHNKIKYNGNQVSKELIEDNFFLNQKYADIVKQCDYTETNIEDIISKYDHIIIAGGGSACCPCFYDKPREWFQSANENTFDLARDISEYIIISYCIEHNIPLMCICRGYEMYGVVTGCEAIQDLKGYFEERNVRYNNFHGCGNGKNKIPCNHNVKITDKKSWLYSAHKKTKITHPFSNHNQAINSVNTANTKVVATSTINGITTIEAVENTKMKVKNILIQWHPEHSAISWLENKEDKKFYEDLDSSLTLFKYFIIA